MSVKCLKKVAGAFQACNCESLLEDQVDHEFKIIILIKSTQGACGWRDT